MYLPKLDLIKHLSDRGFIYQSTDLEGVDNRSLSPISGYIGFDCTAQSLHVGSLVQIMMLRRLQQTGHRPIILMGGGTTKIGDPSGKDESRKLIDEDQISSNMKTIKSVFHKFLSFGNDKSDAVFVDNDEWLSEIKYIPFLQKYGSNFSINRMLGFESVKLRLEREQPLSFLEFNYMILQAYDFLELSRRYDCSLQLGGSDQWGNIVSGIELARRIDKVELFGITSPLITTSSGGKMGKTDSGAIWLNEENLSTWDYWQFWRNTDDKDVVRFLRLFTDFPLEEIRKFEELEGSELNEAKVTLANEATKMCHGQQAANEAQDAANNAFGDGINTTGIPSFIIPPEMKSNGIPAFELVYSSGLVSSKGEARKIIRAGGVKINEVVIADETEILGNHHLIDGQVKLSIGRKRLMIGKLN